jgi:hypothetical protein
MAPLIVRGSVLLVEEVGLIRVTRFVAELDQRARL